MRFVLTVMAMVLAMVSLAMAQEEERPTCENCGMFWDVSPTAVEAVIEIEDEAYTHRFECLGCLHDYVHEHYGEVQPSSLSIVDYSTFGTDDVRMIDGFKAYYLFGTERIKGSMAPYTVAFADEDSAAASQETLGGELVDFKGMKALMMEYKAEAEEAAVAESGHEHHSQGSDAQDEDVYVCSCAGGCCDNISSDQPGSCPQCGMELVRKSE